MCSSAIARHTTVVWILSIMKVSCVASVGDSLHSILTSMRSWQRHYETTQNIPFVTLSFAQSLDGKLNTYKEHKSEIPSSNYAISGEESMQMTHALRSIHDGILIGGNTLELDNPRLTNRLWEKEMAEQPRPIVLDTNLQHLYKVGRGCRMKNPIVCCCREASESLETLPVEAQILVCDCSPEGKLDLSDVLHKLYTHCGICSIMVEGGSEVLSSFLEKNLFHALCLTIAPKILGRGQGLHPQLKYAIHICQPSFMSLGEDLILLANQLPTAAQ